MADLPSGRVACDEPPFTNWGVDLFGRVLIKQGRKQLKRLGVIYTCLSVRCVHLEVVESLETDAFINSLRRFVNRRGSPKATPNKYYGLRQRPVRFFRKSVYFYFELEYSKIHFFQNRDLT